MTDEIICLTPKPLASSKTVFEGIFLHYLLNTQLDAGLDVVVDCKMF